MDFVGKLPREISLHILSFLPSIDLANCFLVCKTWYNLANTDFLWKRHCILKYFDKTDVNMPNTRPSALCKWASTYRTFIRKVNKWEYDKGQYFDITLNSCNFVLAIGQFSLSVYYFLPVDSTLEQLHFYKMCEGEAICQDMIDLELPGRGLVQLITNDTYTLVSRENFVLCFKANNGRNTSYVAISLRGGHLEFATENFSCFLSSKRCNEREVIIRELCGCYLWLEDSVGSIHIFNLDNFSCTRIDSLHEIKFMSNLVAVWSSTTVNIYYPSGDILQSILVDIVQDVCLNKNTLASLLPDTGHHSRLLQTFDIRTGGKLMEKTVMRFTDITLHSNYDHIYALERSSHDLFRISSVCARSGQIHWSVSQPNLFYNLWPAQLKVVSYKHLFVWPSSNRTDKYSVFNCLSGKHLYTSTKVLGNILSISERFCVSIDSNFIHIKSFM